MNKFLMSQAFALVSVLLLVPHVSQAQDAWHGFAASTAMNQMMSSNRERVIEQQERRAVRPSTRQLVEPQRGISPARPATVTASGLTFRPSLTVRRAFVQNFVNRVRAVDPANGAQLQTYTQTNDLIETMATAMRPYGLRVDNMADAYTLWWISAWQANQKIYTKPTQASVDAVKRQSSEILTRLAFMTSASDQIKQEFSEDLFLNTLVIETNVEGAKSNPAIANQLSRVTDQAGKAMSIDFSTMTLTDGGFVVRDRS